MAADELPTGYLHPRWRDMSDWVVHFTREEAALTSILTEGRIRATGPYGNGRNVAEVQEQHLSACFSEIPLDHLRRLYERRGRWGIGFARQFLDVAGGGRVWYLERGAGPGRDLFQLQGELMRAQNFTSAFWRLTPFIDLMSDDFSYRFDWEREWRVPGGLRFRQEDIAFVIAPEWRGAGRLVDLVDPSIPVFLAGEIGGLSSAAEVLGDEIDRLGVQFGLYFHDLHDIAHDLPERDGGRQMLGKVWQTEEAVREAFRDLDEARTVRLVERLSEISPYWVASADWPETRTSGR